MNDQFSPLTTISPLDGRYRSQIGELSKYFSEYALFRNRYTVELRYFQKFVTEILHKKLSPNSIDSIIESFDENDAMRVKEIEKETKHDVKAVEYFLQEKLKSLKIDYVEYVHFGLTSEDINSTAIGLGLIDARKNVVLPALKKLIVHLADQAKVYASSPLLARTHGQPAVPTTMGKEFITFAVRLADLYTTADQLPIEAKVTGAVGNYNAHNAAFPDTDWITFCDSFVASIGLTPNHFTTQILPADSYVKFFNTISLINSILIGFSQDMWRYISDGLFTQTTTKNEVGSSTMPHKVNPIDFENAEGNFGLANALCTFFAQKLPISRLQRDLSDSTVKRNFGSAIAYSILGYSSVTNGLTKVKFNETLAKEILKSHPEVVSEGLQTIIRTTGDTKAYETIKELTRGQKIQQKDLETFIDAGNFDETTKKQLRKLSPLFYSGQSENLVKLGLQKLQKEGFI